MQNNVRTVMLVLKSGGDFAFSDVELLAHHIRTQYRGKEDLRIFCLCDKVKDVFPLVDCTLLPMPNKEWNGWWSKMHLFSAELKQYRPFLYLDLDTAVVGDISALFNVIKDDSFVCLSDFYKKGYLASGVMWIPDTKHMDSVYTEWTVSPVNVMKKYRGDQDFLRTFPFPHVFWQDITDKICSFKVREERQWLATLSEDLCVICFHGHPRIKEAVELPWVSKYIHFIQYVPEGKPKVTVIIPYKENRGWLGEAIHSVPSWAQLLISQGEGNWPENFNKALPQATGDYIKFLHEDDLLPKGSLEIAARCIETTKVDFVHGNAQNISVDGTLGEIYYPPKQITHTSLATRNLMHGGTTLYKRKIFEKLGGYNETLIHSEEYEFNLRCLEAEFTIGYCDALLYYYRRHERQKSNVQDSVLLNTGNEIAEHLRMQHTRQVFTDIYKNHTWRSEETRSGTGSELKNTVELRKYIPVIFQEYGIKKVLDVGCGECNWMKHLFPTFSYYLGIDVVKELIRENKEKFKSKDIHFLDTLLVDLDLNAYDFDVIIFSDVLVHLSFFDIRQILQKVKSSSIPYILMTHFTDSKKVNEEITTGRWRPLRWETSPFNFCPPLVKIPHVEQNIHTDKTLSLWKVEDLNIII